MRPMLVSGSRRSAVRALAVALLGLLAWATPARAQWTEDKGVLIRGTIVTMDEQGSVKKGAVLVRGGKIEAILGPNDPPPAGAIVIDSKGFIFPGLLNLHDHINFNFLPLLNVPKHYENREQWPNGALYDRFVIDPKTIVSEPAYYDRQAEALKYAEIKHLAGGTTSVCGTEANSGASTILVRNVDLPNFGEDKVATRLININVQFMTNLENEKKKVAKMNAWFFHLAEGVAPATDADYNSMRLEYHNPSYKKNSPLPLSKNTPGLRDIDMVVSQLVGIHCTGLREKDFADWKAVSGQAPRVVWSPLSNLMLYGSTTDVLGARRQGALVALGTDWSPSGSKNLLWELKTAWEYSKQKLGGALKPKDLVEMVTSNAAKICKWEGRLGAVKLGLYADLLVVDDAGTADPYEALCRSLESNVQLVLVNGDPIYGDEKWLKILKTYEGTPAYEVVKGSPGRSKALDLKRKGVLKGNQSLEEIEKGLLDALKYDPVKLCEILNAGRGEGPTRFNGRAAMKKWLVANMPKAKPALAVPERLRDANEPLTSEDVSTFLKLKFPNAKPIAALDPIYQENDPQFFATLRANPHFKGPNAVLDLSKLEGYSKSIPATVNTPGIINSIPR